MNVVLIDIKDLKASEYNPRLLSLQDEAQLKESISKFGMVEPIVVNANKDRYNVVIGGHQRLRIWGLMGNEKIPVVYVNLPKDRERELNIRLNRNHGEFDWNVLLKEFDPFELKLWGFKDIDFPKIPETTTVQAHERKKTGWTVLEVKCNDDREAKELSAELRKRGYKAVLKKSDGATEHEL